MTPEQRSKLDDLAGCTMLPGSWDKRFVRDMRGRPDDFEPTEKQATMIDKLHHRYRRQIGRNAASTR